jgi:hypothetical protein
MRISVRALAKVSSRPLTALPPNLQVLPPLRLYRRILRAHRKYLPPAARLLGDRYVKEEFHRTKDTDNPVHVIGFLTQWQVIPYQHSLLILGILSASRRQTLEGR